MTQRDPLHQTTPWMQRPATNGTVMGALFGYLVVGPFIAFVIRLGWSAL